MALKATADQSRRRTLTTGDGGQAEVWLELRPDGHVSLHTTWQSGDGITGDSTGGRVWTGCISPGCFGSAIGTAGLCYVHADDSEKQSHRGEVLSGWRAFDLRGSKIDQPCWYSILQSAGNFNEIRPTILCDGAVFIEQLRMSGYTFWSDISWQGVIFEDGCDISKCNFKGTLDVSYAYFQRGSGYFHDCQMAHLRAAYCHTDQHVTFASCEISGDVSAQGAQKDFRLESCTIGKSCDLSRAETETIFLKDSRFGGELTITDAKIDLLRAASMETSAASAIGPMVITHTADLSYAHFKRRVRLVVSGTNLLNLAGSSFDGGGRLDCDCPVINLADLVVGGPLSIVGGKNSSLLSIQNADCKHLTLSSLDLSDCRFYGCHDLQEIVLKPTVSLSSVPGPLRSRRECIAEEVAWRATNTRWRAKDWSRVPSDNEIFRNSSRPTADTVLTPAQVAGVYRSLRKSVEAQSNEPGACDFYYGEMEMRRLDDTKSLWERAIIRLYWLVSGYGLRGFRSLFWLLCSLVGGSVLMQELGLKGKHSWTASVVAAAQSLVPGLSVSAKLTNSGETFDVVLRIVGPVLLGLTALALRNRVRR